MYFELTEEQKILQESARDFLSNECPKDKVREIEETSEGYSPDLWKKMAELGWMGLLFPEEFGGSGFTFEELIVLIDEMGYNICPSPYITNVVSCGLTILSYGSDEQKKEFLPGIANGETIFTMALTEKDGLYEPDAINVKAGEDGENYIINGTKFFIPFANAADYYLCAARSKEAGNPEEGISLFIVDAKSDGIEIEELKTLAHDKQFKVVLLLYPNSPIVFFTFLAQRKLFRRLGFIHIPSFLREAKACGTT